jgi:hypothetical protein
VRLSGYEQVSGLRPRAALAGTPVGTAAKSGSAGTSKLEFSG